MELSSPARLLNYLAPVPTPLSHIPDAQALDEVNGRFWNNRSFRFGNYEFRPETGDVLFEGSTWSQLTESESETLKVLILAYPLPLNRIRIIEEMQRLGCYWHIDTVKVVVARTRAKLGREIIQTHSRGYLFRPDTWLESGQLARRALPSASGIRIVAQ